MALTIAGGGYHADDQFCEDAMSVIGALFLCSFYGVLVFFPLPRGPGLLGGLARAHRRGEPVRGHRRSGWCSGP